MLRTASSQYVYRIACPFCGDADGYLRVAYEVEEANSVARPAVVTFVCINANRAGHGIPSDTELFAALSRARRDSVRLADYLSP